MGSAASKGSSLPPRAQPSSRQAEKTEERKMALTSCYHTKKAGEKLVDLFYDSLKPEYSALPAPADITHTIRGMGHSRSYARLVEFLENGFSGLPAEVDPSTWMPQKRKLRKQHQVASMIRCISPIIISRVSRNLSPRIFVDFCGGAGHVGLLVAYLFPNWKVICVDLKKKSLELGAQRAEKLGILNYSTACIDVRKFEEKFSVGAALHACGAASDMVIDKCLDMKADFIVCPCCVGGIYSRRSSIGLKRPRKTPPTFHLPTHKSPSTSTQPTPPPSQKAAIIAPPPKNYSEGKRKKLKLDTGATTAAVAQAARTRTTSSTTTTTITTAAPNSSTAAHLWCPPDARSHLFRTQLQRDNIERKLSCFRSSAPNSKSTQSLNASFPPGVFPFVELAKSADFGEEVNGRSRSWRHRAKSLVEADRMHYIKERIPGCHPYILKMDPLNASPKNDILLVSASAALSIIPPPPTSRPAASPSSTPCEVEGEKAMGAAASVPSSHLTDSDRSQTTIVDSSSSSSSAIERIADALSQFPREQVLDAAKRISNYTTVLKETPDAKDLLFKDLTGARHRKIIHAVAESFGLLHRSIGAKRGKNRHVIVYPTRKARN